MAVRARSLCGAILLTIITLYVLSIVFSSSSTDTPLPEVPEKKIPGGTALTQPFDNTNNVDPGPAPNGPEAPASPNAHATDGHGVDATSDRTTKIEPPTRPIVDLKAGDHKQPADFTKILAPLWHSLEQDEALRIQDKGTNVRIHKAIQERIQHISELIRLSETQPGQAQRRAVLEIEAFTSFFSPFLEAFHRRKLETVAVLSYENTEIMRPWHALRENAIKDSKGILIPVTKKDFRSTLHLVSTLRTVLKSTLPIQVVYDGEGSWDAQYQNAIMGLGTDITFLDIASTFKFKNPQSTDEVDLKALAVLASKFEKVIVLQPQVMLLSDPADHFLNPNFQKTGTYLFRSPFAKAYSAQERIELRRQKMARAAGLKQQKQKKMLLKREKDGEKDTADPDTEGVVVLDKSRVEVLTAALVMAWQSTQASFWSDKINAPTGLGGCMSWREAFESCTIEYSSSIDVAVVGRDRTIDQKDAVCGAPIQYAFYEKERGTLVWYNPGASPESKKDAVLPTYWMGSNGVEGAVHKGEKCWIKGLRKEIDANQSALLKASVQVAEEADEKFKELVRGMR